MNKSSSEFWSNRLPYSWGDVHGFFKTATTSGASTINTIFLEAAVFLQN
jgi:hypothetical protein